MTLDIPVDLPAHPLSDQLARVADWACIDPSRLLSRQADIASAFNERKQLVEILLQCCPKKPWSWPAYEALIADTLVTRRTDCFDDDELPTADDAREFHPEALRDMVAHVADKLIANHRALYRKEQIEAVQRLRPFWQIKSSSHLTSFKTQTGCMGFGDGTVRTYRADDSFWETHCTPWNCDHFLCCCQMYSLSRLEMERYVNAGCSPGDEAAADQLRIWEQGNSK